MSENPEQNGAASTSTDYLRTGNVPMPTHAVVADRTPVATHERGAQLVERTFHRTDVSQAPHRTLNRFAPTNIVPANLRGLPETTSKPPEDGSDVQRVCSYPVPGDHVADHYTRVIEQLDRRNPVMASILRDKLERIAKAKQDLIDLQMQLQIEHQRANEDAAKSARELEAKILEVERQIDEINNNFFAKKREIFGRRRIYAADYMAGQALAGIFPNPAEAFGPIARNDRPLLTDSEDTAALEPAVAPDLVAGSDAEGGVNPAVNNQLTPAASALMPVLPDGRTSAQSDPQALERLVVPSGGLQSAPQPEAAPPTIVRLPPGVPLEPQDPTAIPLPFDEAKQRARSLQAIAADEGFLPDGAATKVLGKNKPSRLNTFFIFLMTLVCGAVFAFSLGIITNLVNPDILSMDPSKEMLPFAIMVVAGTVLFYLMGQAIKAFVAHAAELNQNTITAGISKNPLAFAQRIRWSAIWVLCVGLAGMLAVVVIEANVERHGIAHYFHEQLMGGLIAHGAGNTVSSIGNMTLWAIALMAGIPFVLFHASHAWVEARQEVINSHVTNLQQKEVYEIANQIRQDRVERALKNHETLQDAWLKAEDLLEKEKEAAVLREAQERREQLEAWKEIMLARSEATPRTNDESGIDHEGTEANATTPVEEEATQFWQDDDSSLRPMGTVWESTKPELQEKIARSLVDLLSIKSELGIAGTEYRYKLEPFKKRLEELRAQRVQETPTLTPEARRRLDDARMDYEFAVQRFDTYYAENADKIMDILRGGKRSRILGWWLQKPLDLE